MIPACRAPSSAMHFSLTGDVHACCQNGAYSYGNVNEQRLREIWVGTSRRAMAEDLLHGRYPTGCELCEVEHAIGNRQATPAQAFDHFPAEPAIWPRLLEFTLSNRCNLECVQCNGDNSSTIRARREGRPPLPSAYGADFFEQLPPFLEHAEVVSFLGGEPFLAPEAKQVWELLLAGANRPVVRVTTNATVWNDAVERVVHGLAMHVAVSIDGATAATYESIRVGARFDRVVANRDRFLAACRSYGGILHLNYCLMRANWHELGRFLLDADALDVDGNVIPVFGPSQHSLFTLDHATLAPIVAALEDEDRRIGDRLDRNRPAWSATLARLRAQLASSDFAERRARQLVHIRSREATRRQLLDGLVGALGVHVSRERRAEVARRRHEESERLLRIEAEALRSWSGRPPIVVAFDDDVVTSVDVPEWGGVLAPGDWAGLDIAELGRVTAARLGAVELGPVEDRSDGDGLLLVNESTVAAGGRRAHFRTVQAPALGRMLIASPDLGVPVPVGGGAG